MLNEKFILSRIKPYLNNRREISEFEFFELFSKLNKLEQYEVVNIMICNDIDLVEEKDEESRVLAQVHILNQNQESKDISKLMHLTNEQLCIMAQNNDQSALSALLKKNERFVYKIAAKIHRQYNQTCLTVDDCFQEGNIGLIEAMKRFDPAKDNKFITYSWHWVRQKIMRAAVDTGYTIRIPVHLFEKIAKINGIRRKYPNATIQELVEIVNAETDTNIVEIDIRYLIILGEFYLNPTSLNILVGEDDYTELMNFLPDEGAMSVENQVFDILLRQEIICVLRSLKPKEEKVIKMRFGLGGNDKHTLEKVGEIFHVTRERIRQIEAKAIRKLRHTTRSRNLRAYYEEE